MMGDFGMKFNIGDQVRPKPPPPPIGVVVRYTAEGRPVVRWPSGIEAAVHKPEEIEVIERKCTCWLSGAGGSHWDCSEHNEP